jgi:hypothetical protein
MGWLLAVLCQVVAVFGLKAEWTQLSESASLPMSKNYRDGLRERISKIDLNSLNPAERDSIEKLKRMLGDDTGEEITSSFHTVGFVLVIAVIAVLLFLYKNGRLRVPKVPSPEEVRNARNLKYQ